MASENILRPGPIPPHIPKVPFVPPVIVWTGKTTQNPTPVYEVREGQRLISPRPFVPPVIVWTGKPLVFTAPPYEKLAGYQLLSKGLLPLANPLVFTGTSSIFTAPDYQKLAGYQLYNRGVIPPPVFIGRTYSFNPVIPVDYGAIFQPHLAQGILPPIVNGTLLQAFGFQQTINGTIVFPGGLNQSFTFIQTLAGSGGVIVLVGYIWPPKRRMLGRR